MNLPSPIVALNHDEQHVVVGRLADGSYVRFVAQGYEVDAVGVEFVSAEAMRREAARRQGGRERARIRRLEGLALRKERGTASMIPDAWLQATRADFNRQVYGA